MKIKLTNILNAVPILQELGNTKLPIASAYKVRKIIAECNILTAAFDKERQALLKIHAVLSKDKKTYHFDKKKPDDLAAFNEAILKMTNEDIEIEIPKLTLKELEGHVDIEAGRLEATEWFLEEVA